jgi:hypothetical protein
VLIYKTIHRRNDGVKEVVKAQAKKAAIRKSLGLSLTMFVAILASPVPQSQATSSTCALFNLDNDIPCFLGASLLISVASRKENGEVGIQCACPNR